MRQVYTYRSIKELEKHPDFTEFSKYPQITATHDLLLSMRKIYPKSIRKLEDIFGVQESLTSGWTDPDTSLQQFINLSRVIRTLPVKPEEKYLHNSFLKNKSDILKAVRALVEADVSPQDIEPENLEEALFKRIWTNFEAEDTSFSEFRSDFTAYAEDPEYFKSELESNFPILKADTIIMHGFFYINPIQERLMDLMEKCGKNLIFLCCIDNTVPEADAIWYKALTETNNFAPVKQWKSDPPAVMKNQSFGSVFGTTPQFSRLPHIKITEYRTEIDFVQDIGQILATDDLIYCTQNKEADAILRDFYPQIYKRRHLLSYPVGQYIYRLHSMWNAKSQRLELSFEDIQVCFASGWVVCNGINGIDYVDKLEDLRVYVSDCSAIDDWNNRLMLLLETKKSVLAPFESHINEMPSEHQNWHRIMADPFLNFSCFKSSPEDIHNIAGLILHLIDTAKVLFSSAGEVSIDQHFRRIRNILSKNFNEDRLFAEEKIILDELYSRLRSPHLGIQKCLPGEISEAVLMIVGGGILDEENEDILSGKTESRIKPMAQAEAAPALSKGRVHLCLADENRLPAGPRSYPWPLNGKMIRRLEAASGNRKRQYLEDLCFVAENQQLAARYLFFSLLQNDDVEISWISSDSGKKISASPYVQILNKFFHVEVSTYSSNRGCADEVPDIKPANSPVKFKLSQDMGAPVEEAMDAALCPWRYIYGYMLSEFPAFSSDFHYNFELSTLIGSLAMVSGMPKKQISKEVLSLFPYLREVEKQQIKDYAPYYKDSDTTALDGVSYPAVRLNSHFLTRKMLENAQTGLETMLQDGTDSLSLIKSGTYEQCMYCPCSTICPHSCHDSREDN